MTLRPEEISWAIQEEIEKYQDKLETESIGHVLEVGDGIARVWGLDDVMMSELVEFPDGTMGIVLNLEADNVGVVILGSERGIKERDVVKRTKKIVSVPVGEALIGRVIDPLGRPLDGKGPIYTTEYRQLEGPAPGITQRKPVSQPLQTGIKAIDAMIPIGQRPKTINYRRSPNR